MLQSTRSVTKQWLQARRNQKPACFWFAAATCFWPNRFVEHQEPARIVPGSRANHPAGVRGLARNYKVVGAWFDDLSGANPPMSEAKISVSEVAPPQGLICLPNCEALDDERVLRGGIRADFCTATKNFQRLLHPSGVAVHSALPGWVINGRRVLDDRLPIDVRLERSFLAEVIVAPKQAIGMKAG